MFTINRFVLLECWIFNWRMPDCEELIEILLGGLSDSVKPTEEASRHASNYFKYHMGSASVLPRGPIY
jgi:hypothetical protein